MAERLGRLRGLPQKVGQLLSMGAGDERIDLAPLRNAAPPLPLTELLPVLERTWGQDPFRVLRDIDRHGLAASLGQVHHAQLHDGREVAVKVLLPGIRDAVDQDLRALGWLSLPFGGLGGAFDLRAWQHMVRRTLDEELDYRIEAGHQLALRAAADGTALVVPELLPELCGEEVLVSTWEGGDDLERACTWPRAEREALARELLRAFLELVFDRGLVHADPHPGNYAFRRGAGTPEIVLYDHGCVLRLEERERLAWLELVRSAATREADVDPFPLLVELGFRADLLRPLRQRLPALCTVLFEPFASPSTYDLDSWRRGERVADLLGPDRTAFRAAGPPRLLHVLRAFEGLVHHLRRLGTPISWASPLAALARRHGPALSALRLDEPADPLATYGCLAQHLRVRVLDGDREHATLTLPAGAVERLQDFLDEDLLRRIHDHGVDLQDLLRRVRATHYAPQELLRLDTHQRRVEVDLT